MKNINRLALGLAMLPWMTGSIGLAATAKDYAKQALDGKDFKEENLNHANFDGASLKAASFKNATCKNATFRDAKLQGADFHDANLEGADFTGAELKDAEFRNAKAWHVNFAGAEIDLVGTTVPDFSKVTDFKAQQTLMENADRDCGTLSFHYADLHNALILGNAKDVDFRDADLRGADLSKVTHLDLARLGNVKYDENTKWKIDPKAVGAVLVPVASVKAVEATAARNPLVGKWLVLKGEGDAPDNGVLRILADYSFEWDPALSAAKPKPLTGKWTEAGETIELKGGELGQTWTLNKSTHHGKPEMQLQSDKGVKRVAVPE